MPGGVHEHMRAWEPEEDQLIIRLLNELGPKWSKIVEQLPGRSVSSVRNRWQRIDKGNKLREAGKESKNRCQQCGKPKRGHVCLARLQQNRSASAALGGAGSGGGGGGWDDVGIARQRSGGSHASDLSSLAGLAGVAAASRDNASPAAAYEAAVNAAVAAGAAGGPSARRSDAMDDGEAAPAGSVPLLRHVKSGPRICGELGFEALAAAAVQLAERERSMSEGDALQEALPPRPPTPASPGAAEAVPALLRMPTFNREPSFSAFGVGARPEAIAAPSPARPEAAAAAAATPAADAAADVAIDAAPTLRKSGSFDASDGLGSSDLPSSAASTSTTVDQLEV